MAVIEVLVSNDQNLFLLYDLRTAPRTYTVPPPPVVSQRREPISQPVPRDYTPITKARQATVDSE